LILEDGRRRGVQYQRSTGPSQFVKAAALPDRVGGRPSPPKGPTGKILRREIVVPEVENIR